MVKHVPIVVIAVLCALAAASGLRRLSGGEAAPTPAAAAAIPASSAPGSTDAGVARAEDGHYWAEASVNGRRVRFLVDTGATVTALTRVDAQRLGLQPATLTYDRTVSTAAGPTQAAAVQLDTVSVAGARVDKVSALVLDKGLPASLLGMSYLGRLSRFEATPQGLILRP